METRRPDIVLFVNGIPMAVIENKKAADDVAQGVSQSIRNQKAGRDAASLCLCAGAAQREQE